MDIDEPPDIYPITDVERFQKGVRALVVDADANGVDVRGSWPVVSKDGDLAWEILVSSVSRRVTEVIGDGESPQTAVVRAVADRNGVSQFELPPLYEAIEPAVLETLGAMGADSGQRVGFDYAGYRITVHADGTIYLDG